jgi:branched-chain amino acid transport system substrate-binding protein
MIANTANPFARRAFLKLIAGGVGAVSITTLLGACSPAASTTTTTTAAPPAAAGGSTPAAQQAPAAASGAKGELKIGLLSGFSGPYAAFGPDMARSADLYLEQHNGLLGGLKVTTVQEDEGTTTQDALSKARKLVQQDKVDVMMGIVSSANALAIRDTIDQSKTPLIITNANANEITSTQKSDYIFRAAISAWQNGAAMGHWAYQNVGKKFIAMAPDYTAGQQWVAAFKDDFGSVGGTIIDELYPPLGNTDYAPYLAKIKPQQPDGVYAQFAGSDQIKFIQQWTEFIGTSIQLVDSGLNQAICDQVGKAALSSKMGSTAWEPSLDTPVNKAFVDAFQKKYNALPVYGEYHYDAMVLLDKILTANGGDKSSAAIVKGFTDTTEVDSVRGLVKVDPETRGLIVPMFRDQAVEDNGAIKLNIIEKLGTFAPFKRVD